MFLSRNDPQVKLKQYAEKGITVDKANSLECGDVSTPARLPRRGHRLSPLSPALVFNLPGSIGLT
jgi:hypothetical protein